MKTFQEYLAEKNQLEEFFDPWSLAAISVFGTMFLKSEFAGKIADKIESFLDRVEKDNFLKMCFAKLKRVPENPTKDDVKRVLGKDYDRFEHELNQAAARA